MFHVWWLNNRRKVEWTFACNSLNKPMITKHSCKWVYGYDKASIMTKDFHVQTKHDNLDPMSKWCSLFFRFEWSWVFGIFASISNSINILSRFAIVIRKIPQKGTRAVARQLINSQWECDCSFSFVSSSVLCQKSNGCSSSVSLLSIPDSLWLFLILENEISVKGMPFWHHLWHKQQILLKALQYISKEGF